MKKMKRDSTLGKLIRITLQRELKRQLQDMSIKQDLDVADGKRWWEYMWTIQNTLDGIEGDFFKGYDRLDQPITDFEYFSGHLKYNQELRQA